jgi:hypothetical protein
MLSRAALRDARAEVNDGPLLLDRHYLERIALISLLEYAFEHFVDCKERRERCGSLVAGGATRGIVGTPGSYGGMVAW